MLEFTRQQGLVLPVELPPVTVIGVGGIGSFTVLALAKMGVQCITVYDNDKVEDHNLPNQLYPVNAIGMAKAYGINDMCQMFAAVNVLAHVKEFSNQVLERGVVVSGVDSMQARYGIWEQVKGNKDVPLYVEARMGAEVSRIQSVNPCNEEDAKWYEETLYSDTEALDLPCTARAIIYTGFVIAGLIASQIKKFAKGESVMREIMFDLKTLSLLTA